MQFTKFSRTGLSVSRLCLGTGTFGKQTDEAESIRVAATPRVSGSGTRGPQLLIFLKAKGYHPWERLSN